MWKQEKNFTPYRFNKPQPFGSLNGMEENPCSSKMSENVHQEIKSINGSTSWAFFAIKDAAYELS